VTVSMVMTLVSQPNRLC